MGKEQQGETFRTFPDNTGNVRENSSTERDKPEQDLVSHEKREHQGDANKEQGKDGAIPGSASPGEIDANGIRDIQKSEYRKHGPHEKGANKG